MANLTFLKIYQGWVELFIRISLFLVTLILTVLSGLNGTNVDSEDGSDDLRKVLRLINGASWWTFGVNIGFCTSEITNIFLRIFNAHALNCRSKFWLGFVLFFQVFYLLNWLPAGLFLAVEGSMLAELVDENPAASMSVDSRIEPLTITLAALNLVAFLLGGALLIWSILWLKLKWYKLVNQGSGGCGSGCGSEKGKGCGDCKQDKPAEKIDNDF